MFSVRKFHKKRGPNVSSFIWLADMQVPFYFSVAGQCPWHCPAPLQNKFSANSCRNSVKQLVIILYYFILCQFSLCQAEWSECLQSRTLLLSTGVAPCARHWRRHDAETIKPLFAPLHLNSSGISSLT
jgi:hypothetical protein